MNRTEPPSRPLLTPHNDEDANVSEGDTQGVFHTSRSSTPVTEKSKETPRSAKDHKHKISLRWISKTLAFVLTIPSYFVRGIKRCGRALARFWNGRWTAEACSLLFALLSLLGLVTTLLAHQSKPLPQWPRLVTINSIISLFSFFIRAGVGVVLAEGISQSKWQWFRRSRKLQDMERFDLASRGAWGSVQLLFNMKVTKPYLIAALGSWITIMAALNGFVTQQLIQFSECLTPDHTDSVRIERANHYSAFGVPFKPIVPDNFVPIAVAIDIGILQPVEDLTNVLSHRYSTGNCTSPTFQRETFSTLAIGHPCEDVKSQVTKVPITRNNKWTLDEWTVEEGNFSTGNSVRNNYMLSLPMGITDAPLTFAIAGWDGAMLTGVARKSHIEGSMATVKMIVRTDRANSGSAEEFIAVSCSLYPTVNTYAARISNSVLIEELIRSVRIGENRIPRSHPEYINNDGPFNKMGTTWTTPGASHATCERLESYKKGYEPVEESDIVDTNGPIERTGPVNETRIWYLPHDCVWGLHYDTSWMIYDYLNKIHAYKWLSDRGPVKTSNMQLRRFYTQHNTTVESIDRVMASLTRSMTSIVRLWGGYNSHRRSYPGREIATMWYPATCIQIRWPWIAFPASMIGLSAIFLILVHTESRGTEREKLWKSSTLAMLVCEMDSDVKDKAQPVRKQVLKDVAKSTSVSLGRDSEGLRLVVRGS